MSCSVRLVQIAVGMISLGTGSTLFAACGSNSFPDVGSLPPLDALATTITDVDIASVAGLRALEFGTNFQRRSANLFGHNPLIVADNKAESEVGGSASADDELTNNRFNLLATTIVGLGDEKSASIDTSVEWRTAASALGIDYRITPTLFLGAMIARSSVTGCSEPDDNFQAPGSVNVLNNEVSGDFTLFFYLQLF